MPTDTQGRSDNPWWRAPTGTGVVGAAVLSVLVAIAAPFGAADPAAPGSSENAAYVVTFKAGTNSGEQAESREDVTVSGGQINRTYARAVRGFAGDLPPEAVAELRADPDVASVVPDLQLRAAGVQNPAPWNLDRIDQRLPAASGTFSYEGDGADINVYVLDTGIRATHTQFGGRVANGFDAIDGTDGTSDCAGHGTHIAGIVGGSTYGVAKGVTLVPVRVLDCEGFGHVSEVLAGLEWVMSNHITDRSVINMSLGGAANSVIDLAVNNAITAGIPVVVAAGNAQPNQAPVDACSISPARVQNAITVGAVTSSDVKASFSNYGTCLDVFAPGVNIRSASPISATATDLMDGTSQAAPHVAGVLAVLLQGAPGASPAALRATLGSLFTNGGLVNIGAGSPNAMLYAPPKFRLAGVGSATIAPLFSALSADPAALTLTGEPLVQAFDTSGGSPIATQDLATLSECEMARPTSQAAARTALVSSLAAANGCVQFAQAESLDLSAASPRLVYIPFARDNVSYAVSGTSNIPVDLSLADLRDLYACPIETTFRPMLPPVGSGLREFWLSQMYPSGVPSPLPSCVQDGVDEAGTPIGVNVGSAVNHLELVPYSVTQWAGQTSGLYSNRRGLTRVGQVDKQNPFGSSFGLQRDLYVVIPQSTLSGLSFNDLRTRTAFVGVGSLLCTAVAGPLGTRYGFRPHPSCGSTLVTP